MKINEAISKLETALNNCGNEYVKTRLACVIEDLKKSNDSPTVSADYDLPEYIANQITDCDSALAHNDEAWVRELQRSVLNLFRHLQCKQHYKNMNKKEQNVIDGETVSKWITVISAFVGLLFCGAAIALNGFKLKGIDFDKYGFFITMSGFVAAVIAFVLTEIINRVRRKKHDEDGEFSVDELLAVKYEDKPKTLKFVSPTAAKMVKCQIVIGNNNRTSQGNRAKATKGGTVYQNDGDVVQR